MDSWLIRWEYLIGLLLGALRTTRGAVVDGGCARFHWRIARASLGGIPHVPRAAGLEAK